MHFRCVESVSPVQNDNNIIIVALFMNDLLLPPLHITIEQFRMCTCEKDDLFGKGKRTSIA